MPSLFARPHGARPLLIEKAWLSAKLEEETVTHTLKSRSWKSNFQGDGSYISLNAYLGSLSVTNDITKHNGHVQYMCMVKNLNLNIVPLC